MKKTPSILFTLLVFASMLISCKKEFEKLQVQIDGVVSTEINPIKKQIEEINGSIEDLEQTDMELKGYIETLEGTARQLQADITANDTKIDQTATAIRHELTVAQTSLEGNIAIAKTEVVGQLTALRTEMQGKLDAVNATISELKAKDTALETQIANLRNYVDTQMALQTANTKEWANSTFSTLAQYQATTAEIAAIKSSITTLNASLTDLETRLNTKIATDIASAVSTLEGELATTVTEITTAYTSAISTAKTELTTAYTGAIATAISNSETSMKNWVNTQLTGYYTIAKAETKLDSLHTVLNGQLTSQQEYLTAMIGNLEEQVIARIGDEKTLDTLRKAKTQFESALAVTNETVATNTKSIDSLRVNLTKAKTELTESYTAAINTAITTLDGKLTTAVTTINTRIDGEVASLEAKLTSLTSRVSACEDAIAAIQTAIQTMLSDINNLKAEVEALIKQIQSVVVIPDYSDGSVACSSGNTTFQFKVLPTGTAALLAQAPLSAFKMEAIYTLTKAIPSFIDMPISKVEAQDDILLVTASGADLGTSYLNGLTGANASLNVSYGKSNYQTGYFPLYHAILPVDLSTNGSANCYIISSAGNYSFRTSKGNSSVLIDGALSAEVLWESFGTEVSPLLGGVVNKVSYNNNAITFSTPISLQNGNAVIAVKDADNNILWSWHIWVCKDYDPVANAQTYYNNAGTMMDRNLGATSAEPGNVGALGLFYQWGRKDPFLGSSSISSDSRAASTLISWPSPVSSNSSNGTIDFALKHPTTFIKRNSINSDWYYTGDSSTDDTRWKSSKTIYDPCPLGWIVPMGGSNGVWAKAAKVSSEFTYAWDLNNGMNFSGKFGSASNIWYPAAGAYDESGGTPVNTGRVGYWWSCTPTDSGAYYLDFTTSSKVIPSGATNRVRGISVRCIQEKSN